MPRRSATTPGWTVDDAEEIGTAIGIDWDTAKFDPEAFLGGLKVELEHGSRDKRTDVTGDDPELTGKIAWAHLLEDPEYYVILKEVESRFEEQQKEGSVPEAFLPISTIGAALSDLTARYASLRQHRAKILRRASKLAETIALLDPGEVLENEAALRRLAGNALSAADHLDNLASGVEAVKEVKAAIRTATRRQER